MKRNLIFLLLVTLIFGLNPKSAYTEHLGDTLTIGKGNAATKKIVAKRASGSTNPALQWNESTSRWEFSNNGTSFTAMGSGSGGSGINYITEWDAEDGLTTGWATYADAAGTSPVDGTGGAANVTFTNSSSSPLRGNNSFLFTKDAANRQGQGVAYAFTINSADVNKVLTVSFDHSISSGTFVGDDSADLQVFMYDVTNSTLIPVTGNKLTGGAGPHKFAGTFQTTSSTSYRLILHVATTSASAYVIKLDNVSTGPQTVQYGAPVSDWTSFTPTGTWIANTTYTGFYRRVGDSLQVECKIALGGAPTSATLNVNLPSGFVIDVSKLSGNDTDNRNFGTATLLDSGTGNFIGRVGYSTTTAVAIFSSDDASGGVVTSSVSQSAPFTFANGDEIYFSYEVPIAGWSSTVQMSNDTDTRVVAAGYTTPSGTISNGVENLITYTTKLTDTHSAYSSGIYTIQVSGVYEVSANIRVNATISDGDTVSLNIYKNANNTCSQLGSASSNVEIVSSAFCIANFVAGDTISVRGTPQGLAGSPGYSAGSLNIKRLSGPSAIAASEKVYLQYTGNGGGALTQNVTNIDWTTKVVDSHGAWSGTTFTAPRAGFYLIQGMVSTSSGNSSMDLYKGGSLIYGIGNEPGSATRHSVNGTIYLLAGETITVRSGASGLTLSNSATHHWISISGQ